jgi:hypothetical protein
VAKDDVKVGINYPPLHLNCRSTVKTVFVDEDEKDMIAERFRSVGHTMVGVRKNMTYAEWKAQFNTPSKPEVIKGINQPLPTSIQPEIDTTTSGDMTERQFHGIMDKAINDEVERTKFYEDPNYFTQKHEVNIAPQIIELDKEKSHAFMVGFDDAITKFTAEGTKVRLDRLDMEKLPGNNIGKLETAPDGTLYIALDPNFVKRATPAEIKSVVYHETVHTLEKTKDRNWGISQRIVNETMKEMGG